MAGKVVRYGDGSFGPCRFDARSGESTDAEWGTLTVPENRRVRGSNAITLAMVRFRATTDRPGDPVVYLAGGPGESGIEIARGRHFPLFMALREAGDVIVLDQRGTGHSRPALRCDEYAWRAPLARPSRRDDRLRIARDRSAACATALRNTGVDLSGYNTIESADDLNNLRASLGAERVHLFGASYGTHLALAALRRHAPRIGRCVLGGAEGPDHTCKLPSVVQTQLESIGAAVREHPDWGRRVPDFVSTVRGVLDRLETDPVVVGLTDPGSRETVDVGLGRFDVEYATAAGLADTRVIALLPAWYEAMSRGDFSLPDREPVLARYLFHGKRGLGKNAMAVLMDCASGVSPWRLKRIENEAADPGNVLGRTIDFPFPEITAAWGVPDLGEDFRAPVEADNPVLFFSGSWDCRTPLANVEEVRRGLPVSAVIRLEGGGHTDVFLSCPDLTDTLVRFFRGESVGDATRTADPPFRFAPPPA